MQKTQYIIVFFLLFAGNKISAQQISPSVVSSSGGFYSNAEGMLSFTTAEMTAVETYITSTTILTQGFQQFWDLGTSVSEHPYESFSFGIYPNPSSGKFNLITQAEMNEQIFVRIVDIQGKEIMRTEFQHQGLVHIESLDISQVPQGIYLVTISFKEGTSIYSFQLSKKIHITK